MDTAPTLEPMAVSRDATPDYAPQWTVCRESSGERFATVFGSRADAEMVAAAGELADIAARLADALHDAALEADGEAQAPTLVLEALGVLARVAAHH